MSYYVISLTYECVMDGDGVGDGFGDGELQWGRQQNATKTLLYSAFFKL